MKHDKIPVFLRNSDIFVFASSCENMPNTLIEGMAAGLPVCSSSKGPMQEILKNSGMYFDPEDPVSIADSIQKMIDNPEMCSILATQSKEISNNFSWKRCADETFKYLVDIIKVH
jgi:glycosyltransferase involved in cell wall biosynthesis